MQADKPNISSSQIDQVFYSPFVRVFDMQYKPGCHYTNASRRSLDDLPALKSNEEFAKMIPDAVSCFVIVDFPDEEPRLLLSREFRYPVGRFLLSVPAGLISEDDKREERPALAAAARELQEETGLVLSDADSIELVNPLVFSTPGMTDESNALVCVVIRPSENEKTIEERLTQDGAEGQELFDGFTLLTKGAAMATLKAGRDEGGIFYPVYTWMAMMYFVSSIWEQS